MKKINKNFLVILTLVIGIYSCSTNPDLGYENNTEEYRQAISCLHNNYSALFSSAGDKSSIDVYNSERMNNGICDSVLKLLEKHAVSIVAYDKDSTIAFYSKPSKGLKSKQSILVFATNRKNLNAKLTSDIRIVSDKGNGWYELERIISLAN